MTCHVLCPGRRHPLGCRQAFFTPAWLIDTSAALIVSAVARSGEALIPQWRIPLPLLPVARGR